MMKKIRLLTGAVIIVGGLALGTASAGAWAGEECAADPMATQPRAPRPLGFEDVGQATRVWLAYQCSGQAAGKPHPLDGEAAHRGYLRYLKSFEHPIPEFYLNPNQFVQN
ncbi:DUF3613 domain-containing protein [Thauera propionica]|jgi:hypothetical protein|uniref:DUF3613 domain-containing protein n=1 Tax=Thauera propionica TaxID=2019431 RepID=UPI0023EF5EC0|nr:DUF3613 domain-containing protein [Thauera propionica]MDD3676612.1 DUF3613 domain-containing protein [Thauera propionica]